jgi:hypothetical protein
METCRRHWFAMIFTLPTLLVLPGSVWAACEPDESEIVIVTPSGKMRILCIPAAAVDGIENAADHSPGTIVAAVCPCFSQADIDAISGVECFPGALGKCLDDFSATCGDGTTVFGVSSEGDSQCSSFTYTCSSSGMSQVITVDEFDACVTLLEPFLPMK